jgi:hypothetical protein
MGAWLNGGAPLAVVIARFLLSNKSLLFSFAGLDLCLSMHRRTPNSTKYTQSSILRNTETASTHQSVSYLNAFPRCDPFPGGLPGIIAFPGFGPY